MFDGFHYHAQALHDEMVSIFWVLLPALVSLLILLEIIKGDEPRIKEILKRTVLCILLLLSFGFTINLIAMLSDEITRAIGGDKEIFKMVEKLGPQNDKGSKGLFDVRGHIMYIISIIAYLISYIGFFASVTVMHFVWAVLYISSPLLLLCYIPPSTASIVGNLYRGLIHVAVWKIMWTLLGSLLLKSAFNPNLLEGESYLMLTIMNLLIGLSMLLIPLFTKSLISDGLQNMASGMAAVPGILIAKSGSLALKKYGKKGLKSTTRGIGISTRPASIFAKKRMKSWTDKMKLNKRFKKRKGAFHDKKRKNT